MKYKIKLLAFVFVFASIGILNAQVTMNNLDQNADQSQGQYQPLNMGYAGFNSLGMTQSAWLDPLQNLGEGQSKPAYSKYYWSPDLVLPIRLREGMITLINFPEWELIEDIYIGDNATFDGQISGPNTVMLYPRKGANVGVDTNIMMFGRSGNRYVFYVRSEGVNTERLTNSIIDIEVIDAAGAGSGGTSGNGGGYGSGGSSGGRNFTNSKSLDSTYTKRLQKSDWLKSIPLDPEKFRFDIEVYAPNPEDVVIAPERVWRDDVFTYIDLGEKALNMTQRPIVTLIVERIEVPVGFRTKGPNNRLIIVEAVGDMVLRNGKRIVCLKMRRSDDVGFEYITYADKGEGALPPRWDANMPLQSANGYASYNLPNARTNQTFDGDVAPGNIGPGGVGYITNGISGGGMSGGYNGSYGSAGVPRGNVITSYNSDGTPIMSGGMVNDPALNPGSAMIAGGNGIAYDTSNMQRIHNDYNYRQTSQKVLEQYSYGSGFADSASSISIELGTDPSVERLENLWDNLSSKHQDVLGSYEPFFSVDAPADGQGKELFHLRVGPVKSLEIGDSICSKLGRNGVFCSVVRTQ